MLWPMRDDDLTPSVAVHLKGGPRDGERILLEEEDLPATVAVDGGQYLPTGRTLAEDAAVHLYEYRPGDPDEQNVAAR